MLKIFFILVFLFVLNCYSDDMGENISEENYSKIQSENEIVEESEEYVLSDKEIKEIEKSVFQLRHEILKNICEKYKRGNSKTVIIPSSDMKKMLWQEYNELEDKTIYQDLTQEIIDIIERR